ncbi:hypothetical protein B0H11DRAFT_1904953 [Mycena galericulata]|nr:hypothetical protein B0H11DRAFT_1904953 [Mycena galericulata]
MFSGASQLCHSQKIILFVLRTKLFLYYTPTGSIFYRIPDKVNLKDNVAEVSSEMALKYKTLLLEEKGLIVGVTRLNTVQRRGKPNISIVDIEEEENVDTQRVLQFFWDFSRFKHNPDKLLTKIEGQNPIRTKIYDPCWKKVRTRNVRQ